MSDEWTQIGKDPHLQEGEMVQIEASGRKILLAKVQGKYFAVQSFCSHMGGDLSKGNLQGYIVSCPRNISKFDLRDGKVVVWMSRFPGLIRRIGTKWMPPKNLQTFPVKVEKGKVQIKF